MKRLVFELSLLACILISINAKSIEKKLINQNEMVDSKSRIEEVLVETLRYFINKEEFQKSFDLLKLIEALLSKQIINSNFESFESQKFDPETTGSSLDEHVTIRDEDGLKDNRLIAKRRTFFVGK